MNDKSLSEIAAFVRKHLSEHCSPALIGKTYDLFCKQVEHDYRNGIIQTKDCVLADSSTGLLSLALAYLDVVMQWEPIPPLIEKVYTITPLRKDVYARCAWKHFWPRKQYSQLIEWMEKDNHNKRLSPTWRTNMAMAYASNGDFLKATDLVHDAYAADAALQDGFAKCAWAYFRPLKQYNKIIEWMEKDKSGERLTLRWDIFLAQAYAAIGKNKHALLLIEQAYAKDSALENGYAQCAWMEFMAGEKPEKVASQMQRDFDSKRMSPIFKLKYAQVLATLGNIKRALDVVKNAYAEDIALRDGYSTIAWAMFFPQAEFKKMLAICRLDLKANRCSMEGKKKFAQALFLTGQWDAAQNIIDACYKADPLQTDWYASLAHLNRLGHQYVKKHAPDVLWECDLARNRLSKKETQKYLAHLVITDKLTPAVEESLQANLLTALEYRAEICMTQIGLGYESADVKPFIDDRQDHEINLFHLFTNLRAGTTPECSPRNVASSLFLNEIKRAGLL